MSHQTNTGSTTIVVIEDNDLNLKLVSALLTSGGYRFFSAKDAEKGLELVKQHLPDLVLMDIQLPGMDGLSATRAIKADAKTRHIPVVALSAHAMPSDRREAASNGVAGYITKPFCTRTFNQRIQGYLPSKCSSSEKTETPAANTQRVLVVDDEPMNLKLIKAMLAVEAYEVKCLSKGAETHAVTMDFLPDIILLDLIMPDVNGLEVVQQLKSDPKTHNVSVVLITGLDSPEQKTKALNAGADDFLSKPLNAQELKARVRSLLRMKRYKEQLDGREVSAHKVFAQTDAPHVISYANASPSILIADENAGDARILSEKLSETACHILKADSGKAALEVITTHKPDVVLLDLVFPDMDGWAICRKIKEEEQLRNIQVVIVTALKDQGSRIRGIEAGADAYLFKPVHKGELQAHVNAMIKKKAYLDSLVDKMTMAVRLSITDSLTGLYARGYLKHFLDLEIKRAQRYQHLLAFMMIDVDDFKQYNDTHGHLAGDAALLDLAHLFKANIRATDLPARYGGEEFAIVLPYTDQADAMDVADRIAAAIAAYNQSCNKETLSLPTVSMGISLFPVQNIHTADELIAAADQALYAAKSDGKNCYHVAPGHGEDVISLKAARQNTR